MKKLNPTKMDFSFLKINAFKIAFLLVLLLSSKLSQAQIFCTTTGINNSNDEVKCMLQTIDGGYALVGNSDSGFIQRIFIQKYDALGNLNWSKVIRNNYSCVANSVVQLSDSALMVSGYMITSSALLATEIALVKVKLDGTILFSKKIGNFPLASDESSYASVSCSDGGVLLACQTNKNVNSPIDLMLVKIDAAGNIVWSRDLIDSYYAEIPVSLKRDAQNNFLLAGYLSPVVTSNPDYFDMFLMKLDSNGVLKWSKTLGGNKFDQLNSLCILNNNAGYALCGRMESYVPASASTSAYLAVLDTSGSIKWARTFNLTGFQLVEFNGLAVDAANNITVAGQIQSYNNNDVPVLVHYDTAGKVKWNKVFADFPNVYSSFKSILSSNSGFVLCGKTDQFNSSNNFYLSTTDISGNTCCSSDSLPAYVVDSGFASTNWVVFDTLTTAIAQNGSFGNEHSSGAMQNYCIIAGIENSNLEQSLQVFPNPGKGIYEITWNKQDTQATDIVLYNSLGKRIKCTYQILNNKHIQLHMEDAPTGIYFLKLYLTKNNVLSQIIVKE